MLCYTSPPLSMRAPITKLYEDVGSENIGDVQNSRWMYSRVTTLLIVFQDKHVPPHTLSKMCHLVVISGHSFCTQSSNLCTRVAYIHQHKNDTTRAPGRRDRPSFASRGHQRVGPPTCRCGESARTVGVTILQTLQNELWVLGDYFHD